MSVTIRKMNENDSNGKSYVHYKSWIETYTGLISDSYMKKMTLERCVELTAKYPENTIVAVVEDNVIGFAC